MAERSHIGCVSLTAPAGNARDSRQNFVGPPGAHARRAVDAKLISRAEASRVDRRVRIGGTPPQTSKLGGFVGIHGGGSGTDWTLGCIAVSDAEIEVLFEEMRVGDVVEVRP